jgi:hypothetical protein
MENNMSAAMQCPSCKEQIDDDSRYCDQCGEQIMVCSVCGRPGKGKRCIFDGKEMVPAGGVSAGTASAQSGQIAQPVQVTPPQPMQQSPASGDKIKLSSQGLGIVIEAKDGDIIGRKNGPFANIFGSCSYVSGTHCKITKKNGCWHIEDMGSTNGTFYNGSKIAPNTSVPVSSNTTVKIADIELHLTYDSQGGGTSRI